jgi:transposase-like protein
MEALSPEVPDADVEDVRTIGRKGTGGRRVEILTRERRRTWTPEQKRAIVAESLGSEVTPTEVARKYAISNGQLYAWRQRTGRRAQFRRQAGARRLRAIQCAPAIREASDRLVVTSFIGAMIGVAPNSGSVSTAGPGREHRCG